jgi:hypothetical protein
MNRRERRKAMTKRSRLQESNSLTDLAARIRGYHEATVAALGKSLEYGMAAGDLLIEAKAQLKHGEWLPWLEANCGLSERSAQVYMRLARNREKVKSAVAADLDLTIDAALQLLANPNAKASEPVDLDELSLGQIMQLKLWRIDPRINLLPLGLSLPEI